MSGTSIGEALTWKPGDKILVWIPSLEDQPKYGRWWLREIVELLLDTGRIPQIVCKIDDDVVRHFGLDEVQAYQPHSVFMAIGLRCWRRAATQAEAMRAWRREAGSRKTPSVYKVSNAARVDGMGALQDVEEPQYVCGPDIYTSIERAKKWAGS